MSKKILFFPKLCEHKDYHYFPISLLSVAASMWARGEEVTIVDARVENLLDIDLVLKLLTADEVKMSVYTGYQLSQAYLYSKWIKKYNPDIKITWGGPHVTALPEQTLANPYIDEVVCGDVDDGTHPLPYHLIDLERYINPETKRFIAVTSYGCPGRCSFCQTEPPRPYKLLPMERIQADIVYLMNHYPYKEALFFDASLFSVLGRVKQISEIMKFYNLKWICDARAVEVAKADDSFLETCVNSGLRQVTVGLESGSPKIVQLMNKGKNHLEHFKTAAKKLAKLPVKLVSGTIFGTPTESVDDLKMTLDYILKVRAINPNFFISSTFYRPLPNTVMSGLAKQHGYVEPDSLEAWAEQGEKGHYQYNQWQESPWIVEADRYRQVYETFRSEHEELFV